MCLGGELQRKKRSFLYLKMEWCEIVLVVFVMYLLLLLVPTVFIALVKRLHGCWYWYGGIFLNLFKNQKLSSCDYLYLWVVSYTFVLLVGCFI